MSRASKVNEVKDEIEMVLRMVRDTPFVGMPTHISVSCPKQGTRDNALFVII